MANQVDQDEQLYSYNYEEYSYTYSEGSSGSGGRYGHGAHDIDSDTHSHMRVSPTTPTTSPPVTCSKSGTESGSGSGSDSGSGSHTVPTPHWFPRLVVRRPVVVAVVSLGTVVALGVFALAVFGLDSGGGSGTGQFLALSDPIVRQGLAYEAIVDYSQPGVIVPRQSERTEGLVVFFAAHGGNTFTPAGLEAIRVAQDILTSVPGYADHCLRSKNSTVCKDVVSPRSMFFEDNGRGAPKCSDPSGLLTQACIDAILADPQFVLDNKVFFSKSWNPTSLTNPITRAIIEFGGPLDGFQNRADRKSTQESAFESLMKAYIDVFEALDGNADVVAQHKLSHVGDTIISLEVQEFITRDLLLTFGSVLVVFFLLACQTWSPIIASAGMAATGCSFFGAYFVYRVVAQIKVWPIPNALGLILLLGIAADDVLVLVDAWRQVSNLPAEYTCDPAVRMHLALKRAASSTLSTSLTTFGAFVATSFSPIPAISTFGLFAAFLVATVYVLCITFVPAVMYMQSKWCSARLCFVKNKAFMATHEKEAAAAAAAGTAANAADAEADAAHTTGFNIAELRLAERFFHNIWSRVIHKGRFVIVVGFVIALGFFIWGFTTLKNPNEPQNGLPEGSAAKEAVELATHGFDPDPASEVNTMHLVFGVAGLRRVDSADKDLDRNVQGEVGQLVFDPTFDLSAPESQTFLVDSWDSIIASVCPTCGTGPSPDNLVLESGLTDGTRSFMSQLRAWRLADGKSFPIPAAEFNAELAAFLDSDAGLDARSGKDVILSPDGVPLCATLHVVTPISVGEAHARLRDWYRIWTDVVATLPRTAGTAPSRPAGLRAAFPTLGAGSEPRSFAWTRTFELMTDSVFQTIFISLAIAFVMLMAISLNLFLTVMATVVLGTIVTAIVSIMSVVLGWTLGVNEALGLVMIVGLAVDYSIHMVHSYAESEESGHLVVEGERASDLRFAKMRQALTEMGVSIVGGALTTLGAASVLLIFAKLPFFLTFASTIFVTILTSLVSAFTMLVAVLAAFGPLGNQGRIKHWIGLAYAKAGGTNARIARWCH